MGETPGGLAAAMTMDSGNFMFRISLSAFS